MCSARLSKANLVSDISRSRLYPCANRRSIFASYSPARPTSASSVRHDLCDQKPFRSAAAACVSSRHIRIALPCWPGRRSQSQYTTMAAPSFDRIALLVRPSTAANPQLRHCPIQARIRQASDTDRRASLSGSGCGSRHLQGGASRGQCLQRQLCS